MPPRFAYFIMVHHLPQQFEWLMNAIYDPDDLFLVHVDLKSRLGLKKNRRGVMREVRRICAGKPNVRLMRSRFTNWGGWSLSKVLLDAIRIALRSDPHWRYFVNLSGQCYPLKPIAAIKREIAAAGDTVHVEMLPIAELPADDWHHNAHPMIETPLRALILPGRKAPPPGFSLTCKGSQWVILPRGFCEWAIEAPLTKRISSYLRGRLLSDELVMQALLENGPYADRLADHYGRAIVWPGPKTMTAADLPMLAQSPAWFARKFSLETDVTVLKQLSAMSDFPAGPEPLTIAQR